MERAVVQTQFFLCVQTMCTSFLSVIVVKRKVSLCVAMKVLLKEPSPDPLTQAQTDPYLFCIKQLKCIIKGCLLSWTPVKEHKRQSLWDSCVCLSSNVTGCISDLCTKWHVTRSDFSEVWLLQKSVQGALGYYAHVWKLLLFHDVD